VGEAGVAKRGGEDRVGAVILMATYAVDFLTAFREYYDEARKRKSEIEWRNNWHNTRDWSQMLIYDEDAEIRKVAPRLGLQCLRGEPFRLDAVFQLANDKPWCPPHVAIEHENNPHGFRTELRALLSIRCPLKVGITYTLRSDARSAEKLSALRDTITRDIREAFAAFEALNNEDPDTEYLFLVGSEEKPHELRWFSRIFCSVTGPTEFAAFA
jgi:hypothetical protein